MWVFEFLGFLGHQNCLCIHLENPGCLRACEHLGMQNMGSQAFRDQLVLFPYCTGPRESQSLA